MSDPCIACGALLDGDMPREGHDDVCLKCGHRRIANLFVVFGPSGAGKSSLAGYIRTLSERPDCVYLDSDVILVLEDAVGNDEYAAHWLNLCSNIAQSGRPCVLFTSIQPEAMEKSNRRDLFRRIHYLGLYCSDDELAKRLSRRPQSRKSSSPEVIAGMQRWAHAIRDGGWGYGDLQASGALTPHDTTNQSIEETAADVCSWIARSQ